MAAQTNPIKSMVKKGLVGLVLGGILFVLAKVSGFPPIFQYMFVFYVFLGTVVFILLDAPPLKPLSGAKAVIGLLAFYLVLSGALIGGASLWPQYDPEVEKGKIEKILARRKALTEGGKKEELIARAKVLSEKADAIMARLKSAGVGAAPAAAVGAKPAGGTTAAAGDLVALGREQWDLQECYNCHALFGKKSKKRGPKLDNIGNLMTSEQLREKLLYPKTWMAEGFEKQYKKGKMPDKYRDLMFDEEVDALVAFLVTLKDTSVETPKAINMKKK